MPVPRPGDGQPNGGIPTSGVGPIAPDDQGHSSAGSGGSSNGPGHGGPRTIEYDHEPAAVSEDDDSAEVGAAVFDWFIDSGIGTSLDWFSKGTWGFIRPQGGLGPWIRGQVGSIGILGDDVGNLGTSESYMGVKLGLDVLTVIATFRLGSGPPSTKALPILGPAEGVWFSSFRTLKSNMASGNMTWHHIVEQSAGFPTWLTNNSGNVIRLDATTHGLISKFYSSNKAPFTGGKTVREWLKGRSFEEHYEVGMWVLRRFGVVP